MATSPATTIDEVIVQLEAIIAECSDRGERFGYFPALYNRVTITVRDGVRRGEFDDNARMEKLDVIFANRYIEAYRAYRAGDVPTRSWLLSFEACKRDDLCVLQHLFLGMNAHIHLDLGIAAGRVAPGVSIKGLERDFNKINEVLASLVPTVEEELEAISPHFKSMLFLARKEEEKLANFSMGAARMDAWHFATRIANANDGEAAVIADRDGTTHGMGELFLHLGPMAMWLKSGESKDVRANIAQLASGEFDLRALVQSLHAPSTLTEQAESNPARAMQ